MLWNPAFVTTKQPEGGGCVENMAQVLQRGCIPVLVNEEHSEVVGESSEHGLVRLEEDISDGHSAVAQEAKLPLRVKLLQQDKTMVGQLHSSTCTKGAQTQTHAEE